MKAYGRELRLECLRLANSLANSLAISKQIAAKDVVSKAEELFVYVDTEPCGDAADINGDRIDNLDRKAGA